MVNWAAQREGTTYQEAAGGHGAAPTNVRFAGGTEGAGATRFGHGL